MSLEVQVLGGFGCRHDGEEVALGGRRQRTLLAALVAAAGSPISQDRLAEVVWGEIQPTNPRRSLGTIVSRLRKVLARPGIAEPIVRTAAGYALTFDDIDVDAHRFEQLAQSTADRAPDDIVGGLQAALSLWGGVPYEEFADLEFAVRGASRLIELRFGALEQLGSAFLDTGRSGEAATVLQSAVDEQPLRERPLVLLMRALYLTGRQSDALDAYQRYRIRLGEDLGLEPSQEARDLEQQVLEHDPALRYEAVSGGTSPPVTNAFLLANLEDADELWEKHPESMTEAAKAIDGILRSAVNDHGGLLFASGGDVLSAAFDTVSAAAKVAVAAQAALHREVWPERLSVGVRMGIHVGTAIRRGEAYHGTAANRASRLMAVAHGGQILASAPAAALLSDTDDPEIGLVDLGRVRLREFARPERVFQVTAPDTVDFPTLRGAVQRPGSLPHDTVELFGRDRELDDVTTRLVSGRLVTIVGTAGVGKTTLALTAARHAARRFPDGVWLCELGTAADAGAGADAVAASLNTSRSSVDGIAAAVRNSAMLLVLDNCEHVLDFAAEYCAQLLAACPNLKILATSRQALGLAGEHIVELSPLDTAQAASFVENRLMAYRPGLELTDAEAGAVAELCHRLDGLPLALELAAARARSMSLVDIVERLDWVLLQPSAGSRRWIDRHQTLDAAIRWSYDLLTDAEAAMFDMLSVFVGGLTLDGAEWFLAEAGLSARDAANLFDSLVAKSMVTITDTATSGRYSLLEPLRQHASGRLAERGLVDDMRRHHMRYFAERAGHLRDCLGSDQLVAIACFEADFDNFRTALETAVEFGDAHAAIEIATVEDNKRQLTSRHLSWSALALAIPGAEHEPRRTIAAGLAAYDSLTGRGDTERTERWLEQGMAWMREPGAVADPYLHSIRSMIALEQGQMSTMVEAGNAAIQLAREARADLALSYLLAVHAVLTAAMGAANNVSPETLGTEAIELARRLDSPTMLELTLGCLANVLHEVDPIRAAALRDEGMTIDSGDVAQLQQASGRIMLAFDLGEDPAPFLDRALRHMRLERDLQTDVPMLTASAMCAARVGRADLVAEALGYIQSAPAAPFRRFSLTAKRLDEATTYIAENLAEQDAARHRAAGAAQSAASIVRRVRDAMTDRSADGLDPI